MVITTKHHIVTIESLSSLMTSDVQITWGIQVSVTGTPIVFMDYGYMDMIISSDGLFYRRSERVAFNE
jgi:hypothetical protein